MGRPVLALDVDTMPGLAYALGMPNPRARLPAGLAGREEGKGWQMNKGLRPARLVDRFAARGPDGLRLLELGKLPGSVEPSVTIGFRYVMERFSRPGWDVVGDLAAGTRQAMFGWAKFADRVVVVVDPSAKSRISSRRLARVATHVVANRVRTRSELAEVQAATQLPLLGAIPYDEALAEADRQGLAVIDFAPDSPGVRAIRELADMLIEEGK